MASDTDTPRYALKNAHGVEVVIRPLGAMIHKLVLPADDRHDKRLDDVVLGFNDLGRYTDGTSPYFGVVSIEGDLARDPAFDLSTDAQSTSLYPPSHCLRSSGAWPTELREESSRLTGRSTK